MVGFATVIEIRSTPSQTARAISKRAPSTTRTPSLLKSTTYERFETDYRTRRPIPTSLLDLLCVRPFDPGMQTPNRNCVRPPNVPRRLTAISLSCARVSRRTQGGTRKLVCHHAWRASDGHAPSRVHNGKRTPRHQGVVAAVRTGLRHVRRILITGSPDGLGHAAPLTNTG